MHVSVIVKSLFGPWWWFSASEWDINLRPQSQNNEGFQPPILWTPYRPKVVSGDE